MSANDNDLGLRKLFEEKEEEPQLAVTDPKENLDNNVEKNTENAAQPKGNEELTKPEAAKDDNNKPIDQFVDKLREFVAGPKPDGEKNKEKEEEKESNDNQQLPQPTPEAAKDKKKDQLQDLVDDLGKFVTETNQQIKDLGAKAVDKLKNTGPGKNLTNACNDAKEFIKVGVDKLLEKTGLQSAMDKATELKDNVKSAASDFMTTLTKTVAEGVRNSLSDFKGATEEKQAPLSPPADTETTKASMDAVSEAGKGIDYANNGASDKTPEIEPEPSPDPSMRL